MTATGGGAATEDVPAPSRTTRLSERQRRRYSVEIWLVLLVSLARSATYAVVSLLATLTAGTPLGQVTTNLNPSLAPGRPWLDLTYQLLRWFFALVPVALACYLLVVGGDRVRDVLGLDRRRLGRDVGQGVLLAALVGGAGLLLYIGAYQAGFSLRIAPASLPDVWWRYPVLVISAVSNAVLEEVILCGYLLHRLDQLGWRPWRAVAASALLRGAYHLYQGFGGFVGNFVMGLLFGRFYQRTGRVLPLVVAHSLIDIVAFVGYTLLQGKVPWLP